MPLTEQIFNDQYFERTYGTNFLKGSHPFQHNFLIRYLRKKKRQGRLLDVGCGLGFFIEKAMKYYSCYGIDASEYAIAVALKRIGRAPLNVGDANSLNFDDDYFDIITALDVLEHLQSPEGAISEFNRTLKIDGILLISVPNTESIGLKWKGNGWFAYRDPTHLSLLSLTEWRTLLNNNEFEIIDIRYDGLWDPPYFKRIPKILQYLAFTIPSMFLFWVGVRIPEKFGENIVFVTKKSRNSRN